MFSRNDDFRGGFLNLKSKISPGILSGLAPTMRRPHHSDMNEVQHKKKFQAMEEKMTLMQEKIDSTQIKMENLEKNNLLLLREISLYKDVLDRMGGEHDAIRDLYRDALEKIEGLEKRIDKMDELDQEPLRKSLEKVSPIEHRGDKKKGRGKSEFEYFSTPKSSLSKSSGDDSDNDCDTEWVNVPSHSP